MAIRVRSLLMSFYLPELLLALAWGLILPVLPRLANSLTATVAGAAGVVALVSVGTVVFDVPAGLMAARWRRRTLALVILAALAGAAVAIAVTRSLVVLAVSALVMGAGKSAWMVSRMAYARDLVPPGSRGRVLAALGGVNRIGGFAAGPALGGGIALLVGLRGAFLAQAAMLCLAALALVIWMRDSSLPRQRTDGATRLHNPLRVIRDHGSVLLRAGPAIGALGMVRAARSLFIPLWGESIGLSVAQVGLALGASGVIDMLLFYPTGLIMDRFGRRWAAVLSIGVMSVSMALMPLTFSFTALLVVAMVAGAGNGLGSGLLMTMGTDLAPQSSAGEFLGVWRLISDLGGTAGPAAIGAVAGIMSLAVAGPTLAVIGLIGAGFFIFAMDETLRRT